MGGPERVEDKQISQRGQFPGEIGVVLLLLQAETAVLYQYHLTRLESGALFLGVWSQHVLGQRDGRCPAASSRWSRAENRESSFFHWPWGRPMWERRMTAALCSSR